MLDFPEPISDARWHPHPWPYAHSSAVSGYQTPMPATVKVGGDRDNPLMVREGVTSRQIMEELRQKIVESGLLPTKWKNGGGLINVTPQRVENRSG